MTSKNYVFRNKDGDTDSSVSRAFLDAVSDFKVIDGTGCNFLVQTTQDAANKFAAENTGWVVEPEIFYPLPKTRHSILKPPSKG